MRYHRLGEIPPKRHVQFRENGAGNGSGRLLVEEVMGFEGFSGNESILYHVESPCRIADAGEFAPIVHEEWILDAHVHRHLETGDIPVEGDPISGRRCMMWNSDLEASICRPAEEADYFYRNGEGDELLFVHRSGELETVFGTLPYRQHDYIVIPHGTTYRFRFDDPDQLMLVLHTPGEIETPNRYRNRYGQLLESAPFSHRDMHPPTDLVTHREGGTYEVIARVRAACSATRSTTTRSTSSAGTATSTPTPSTSTTSSRARGGSTCRRPRTRRSRDRTSWSARSAHASSTTTPTRSRCPTTTRICSPRRSSITSPATSARARGSRSARSRCTRRACRTGRSRAWSRSRSAPAAPRSWR